MANKGMRVRFLLIWLLVLVWWNPAAAADAPAKPAANSINWKRGSEKFDANLKGKPLVEVLESIRKQTGWEVFIDPGMDQKVFASFKDKAPDEAMDLLLGRIGYSLVPQRKGSAKLYVYRKNRDQATKRIDLKARKAKPIPKELVVVLKEGDDPKALARKYNATIVSSIEDLNAHRLRFKNQNDADFAKTQISGSGEGETDFLYEVDRPVGGESLGNANLPGLKLNPPQAGGENIIIGLIDTPVQANMAHADYLLPSINLAGDPALGIGEPTHGTSMAESMLRGVAEANMAGNDKPVQILPVDVYGDSPTTNTFDVARGIVEAANSGADIINLSLGGTGDSSFLHNVIKQGNDSGVLFMAAAGNEPVTTPTFPAAYPEVMAVTATDRRGNIASYANRGDFVEVAAPGSMVVPYNGRAYYVTGTSAASAYLSGVAAGMTSRSGRTPHQVGTGIRTIMAVK